MLGIEKREGTRKLNTLKYVSSPFTTLRWGVGKRLEISRWAWGNPQRTNLNPKESSWPSRKTRKRNEDRSHPLWPPPARKPQLLGFRIRTLWKAIGNSKAASGSCNRPESQDTPATMGTGSSRAGKARTFSPPRHWRDPGPGSASHSTPSRQGLADDEEEAFARAAGQGLSRAPSLQLQQPDSDSELLDQVLEECEEDGPQLLPTAAPRRPPRHGSGDCCSRPPEVGGEETAGQREALEVSVLAERRAESCGTGRGVSKRSVEKNWR